MQSTLPFSAGCLCPPYPGRWPAIPCPRHPLLSSPCPPPSQTCQTPRAERESQGTGSPLLPRHSLAGTLQALSVTAAALHPSQKQRCWAQRSTAVWPSTALPAAWQRDTWKMFLFVFNSKEYLAHAYHPVPVTVAELGSPQL